MIPWPVVVLLVIPAIASAADIPEFLHICKRNDPNINSCIMDSIAHVRSYLVKGIPELNIPTLEPLVLDELVAVDGSTIKISANDIKAYGSSDFTVSNVKVDTEKLFISIEVAHPHLYIDGNYHMDGKLLLLPLKGSGRMRANFTDCKGSVEMQGKLRKNDAGEEILYCTDFALKTKVGSGSIHFDNLFGGEGSLGDVVNSAINNNFDLFVRELSPLAEKALAKAFKDIANNIVNSFTYQQILPGS